MRLIKKELGKYTLFYKLVYLFQRNYFPIKIVSRHSFSILLFTERVSIHSLESNGLFHYAVIPEVFA